LTTKSGATETGKLPRVRRDALESILVVDTDVHVTEDPDGLAEYGSPPWDAALRRVAELGAFGYRLPGVAGSLDFYPPFPGGSNRALSVGSPQQMREQLDSLHIDQAILFPDYLLNLAMIPHPEWASALARAYNAWLYEHWLLTEPTLKGAIAIAPQDPASAADEIRRHAEHREFVCIFLPAAGLRPLYGHRQYDPIFSAAVANDLPVCMHSVIAIHPAYPFNLEVFESPASTHALSHTVSVMANAVSLLETGVPVRFPELRIGFLEAGVGWIWCLMTRMDKEFTERRRYLPILQERPSHYMRQWFYGTQPIEEPEQRNEIVTVFALFGGEDQAMFASDWPHHDFDHPQHVFGLPFSSAARKKIMGENAVRFFRLDPSERRRPASRTKYLQTD
jgi:uncharacterized protein